MKKKLFLLVAVLVAGFSNTSADEPDFSSVMTKSSSVSVTVENDANFPWTVSDGWLGSTNKDHNSDAAITLNIACDKHTKISFDYYHSAEGSDRFYIEVNGSSTQYNGNSSAAVTGSFTDYLSPGTNTLTLRYKKDFSASYGEDLVKVQHLTITDLSDAAVMKTIQLSAPGTLGNEVLAQVDKLTDVTSMKISGTLNSDDWNTLNIMNSLVYLDLSETTVTEIPASAFVNSSNTIYLHGIVWPANLEKIGERAFYNGYLTGAISFPATLTSIGQYAFYNNPFTEVTLPAALRDMGTYVFHNCTNLKTATFNCNLETLPERTFYSCARLESVAGLESVKSIQTYAFYNCQKLRSVEGCAPESVGAYAFQHTALDTIDLSHAENIYAAAFNNCDSLKYIDLPVINTMENSAFSDCQKIKRITIGDYISTIPAYAFGSCPALEEVTLGASVSHIDREAFNYYNATNITKIYVNAPAPPSVYSTDANAAPFRNYNATLYVPQYAMVDYKLHDYWKGFSAFEVNTNEVENVVINHPLNLASTARIPNTPNVSVNRGGALVVNGAAAQPMKHFVSVHAISDGTSSETISGVVLSRCQNMTSTGSEARFYLGGNSYWYFICPPFDVNMADITTTENAELAIRYYDGAGRAAGETGNWKDMPADGVLKAGQGYIFCSSTACYVWLPATEETHNQIFASEDLSVALNEYSSADVTDANWNLVGNPYAAFYNINYMDFTAPITRWDTDRKTYTAYSIVDDAICIRPLEAFFVQKPEGATAIGFPAAGRQTNATIEAVAAANAKNRSGRNANRYLVELTLDGGEAADMTRIVVNPAASDEYNAETDAAKMMAFETTPQLYSLRGTTAYAINEGAQAEGTVQIGMWLPADGNYTLNLKRMDTEAELLDNGTPVAMPYTFTAAAGYEESRFAVRIKQPTAIEQVNTNARQDIIYDLQGRRIQQPMQHGVYIKNGKKIVF